MPDLKAAFEALPETIATQQSVWFRLEGDSLQAVIETIALNEKPKQERNTEAVNALAERLGLLTGVIRKDTFYGASIHYPEVFAHPLSSVNEFYMLCPIGLDPRTFELRHFEPVGGVRLKDDEVSSLTNSLFPAQGASIAFIRREPVCRQGEGPGGISRTTPNPV